MPRLKHLLPLSVLLASPWSVAAHARALEPDGSDLALEAASELDAGDPIGPIVVTRQGILVGTQAGPGATRVFLGVPYAVAPAGPLRFRPPQRMPPWQGIRAALTFGPACVQPPGGFAAPGPQSEDCLSLNVYAANQSTGAPVMVFIHGGAFVTGAGAQLSGQSLAEAGGAIVVTINYRLGALGFLSVPELDTKGARSGNLGLRDQQLALAWVQENIEAFGGDPDNVTVFGESAGAVSACIQMVSPLGRGLANRFILESGTCDAAGTTATLAQARARSAQVVNAFCAGRTDVAACLREVPASDLVAGTAQTDIFDLDFLPVVDPDDPLLPLPPRELIAAGDYNKGGAIIGTNARELGLFQLGGAAPVVRTIAELNAVIDARFGSSAPLVRQQYAPASDAAANDALTRLGTDLLFRCPARALARRTSGQGTPVFLYHFEEGLAFHAFELPYVFKMPDPRLGAPTLVELVSEQFQTAFTSFAAVGVPQPRLDAGSGDLPPWPRYDAATDRHISVKRISEEGTGLSRSDCDLLESIGAVQ